MTTVATAIRTDEKTRLTEAELRDAVIALAKDGARVFCLHWLGDRVGCLSAYITRLTFDHVIFDALGRAVPIALAQIITVHEVQRKNDPTRVVFVGREKEPTT